MNKRGIIGRRVHAFGGVWTIKAFYPAARTGFIYSRYILERRNHDCVMARRSDIKFVRGDYRCPEERK